MATGAADVWHSSWAAHAVHGVPVTYPMCGKRHDSRENPLQTHVKSALLLKAWARSSSSKGQRGTSTTRGLKLSSWHQRPRPCQDSSSKETPGFWQGCCSISSCPKGTSFSACGGSSHRAAAPARGHFQLQQEERKSQESLREAPNPNTH